MKNKTIKMCGIGAFVLMILVVIPPGTVARLDSPNGEPYLPDIDGHGMTGPIDITHPEVPDGFSSGKFRSDKYISNETVNVLGKRG